MLRPLDQGGIPLHTQHLTRPTGEWQREVAETAEEVQHPILWLHLQLPYRMCDERSVDLGIDLHEIRRQELEAQSLRRQRVMQTGPLTLQRLHRVGPAALQVHPQTALGLKRREGRAIGDR